MKKATLKEAAKAVKTKYAMPTLKLIGTVKKLTLKTGSSVDGFGALG